MFCNSPDYCTRFLYYLYGSNWSNTLNIFSLFLFCGFNFILYLNKNLNINNGSMMDGTVLNVVESDINPWDLKVEGVAVPVNSTLSIGFSLYIESPNATVNGGE